MTDWSSYGSCDVCPAKRGEACFTLSAGGPKALPETWLDVPHSKRPKLKVTA